MLQSPTIHYQGRRRLIFGPEASNPDYTFLWLSSVTSDKSCDSTLKQTITTSFHIHSISSFTILLLSTLHRCTTTRRGGHYRSKI